MMAAVGQVTFVERVERNITIPHRPEHTPANVKNLSVENSAHIDPIARDQQKTGEETTSGKNNTQKETTGEKNNTQKETTGVTALFLGVIFAVFLAIISLQLRFGPPIIYDRPPATAEMGKTALVAAVYNIVQMNSNIETRTRAEIENNLWLIERALHHIDDAKRQIYRIASSLDKDGEPTFKQRLRLTKEDDHFYFDHKI